jgi:hypothetical protein
MNTVHHEVTSAIEVGFKSSGRLVFKRAKAADHEKITVRQWRP